jgi:single-stranded DNA-binding protein
MTNGESAFVNVIAFGESAMTALLALDEGDSIALAGELTVSTYTAKNGEVRALAQSCRARGPDRVPRHSQAASREGRAA